MTLEQLVVGGGVGLLVGLVGVLALLSPWRRSRTVLCLKTRPDAGCPAHCLRTCTLAVPDRGHRLAVRVRQAAGHS